MFADDDFKIKPNRSKPKKKEANKKQVQFANNKVAKQTNEMVNGLL